MVAATSKGVVRHAWYLTPSLFSTKVLPSGKVTSISTGTLVLNSSSLFALIASYTSPRTLIQPGLASLFVKLDPPIIVADASSIRGPELTRARRPCWPDALEPFTADADSASFLDSDAMRAARTAGSSDSQRDETSSGMVMGASAMVFYFLGLTSWLGVLCHRTDNVSDVQRWDDGQVQAMDGRVLLMNSIQATGIVCHTSAPETHW
mmetsp:Transcript_28420/g.51808  ORF Transcript_28420/g.51808 Transcript_28420/m.51808 type:complete len:207 (+) Transcript_28420:880-1500(+)